MRLLACNWFQDAADEEEAGVVSNSTQLERQNQLEIEPLNSALATYLLTYLT
jgi:hypothetical protein